MNVNRRLRGVIVDMNPARRRKSIEENKLSSVNRHEPKSV